MEKKELERCMAVLDELEGILNHLEGDALAYEHQKAEEPGIPLERHSRNTMVAVHRAIRTR